PTSMSSLMYLCCNLRTFGSAMEDGGEAYSCRDARPCVQQSSFPLPSSSAGDPRPRFWPLRVVRGRVPWSHTEGAFYRDDTDWWARRGPSVSCEEQRLAAAD